MKIKFTTLNKKNIEDFAKERNFLLKKTKSEWVFFIDNDEKLDKPINQLFSESVTCYKIQRKNYFLGKYVGTDDIIRLVKKGTGKWVRVVHEYWKTKYPVGMLNDVFLTHNTASNLKDYINKINFYSDLHAKANYKEGKKSSLFKIIFFPIGKFFVTLLKSKHVVFSIMQALHSFLSWTKLYLYY